MAALVGLLAFAYAIASNTPALATVKPPPKESLAVFETQLHSHQVSKATLHTSAHTLHISLTNGRKAAVVFSSSQQQQLLSDVRADGITVKVANVKPPPHKLRYILGGVLVVIVLAVVGLLLVRRRRRIREEEEGPRAPARYSTGG